jgi:hypothetical protein
MGMNMGDNFSSKCSTQWCCEGDRCAQNFKGFIDPSEYGKQVAGCQSEGTPAPPAGTVWVGPTADPTICGDLDVLGGCDSNSFFENEPDTEYTFAFVVDKRGIYTYRWLSKDPQWDGLEKYSAAPMLKTNRPNSRPTKTSPPCLKSDEYCLMFHPSSPGERACVTAGGDPTFLQGMAVATAAGSNWWNWFNDTGHWWDYDVDILNKKFP